MPVSSSHWCWLTVTAFAVAAIGCGSKGPSKVEGVVTLDGKPLEGAAVAFLPTADGGRQAAGTTGSDGSFRLTTFNFGDGAIPGEYKVTITKVEEKRESLSESDMAKDSKAVVDMMKKMQAQQKKPGAAPAKPKSLVPAMYSDGTKTPLKQVVPADGALKFDLRSTGS